MLHASTTECRKTAVITVGAGGCATCAHLANAVVRDHVGRRVPRVLVALHDCHAQALRLVHLHPPQQLAALPREHRAQHQVDVAAGRCGGRRGSSGVQRRRGAALGGGLLQGRRLDVDRSPGTRSRRALALGQPAAQGGRRRMHRPRLQGAAELLHQAPTQAGSQHPIQRHRNCAGTRGRRVADRNEGPWHKFRNAARATRSGDSNVHGSVTNQAVINMCVCSAMPPASCFAVSKLCFLCGCRIKKSNKIWNSLEVVAISDRAQLSPSTTVRSCHHLAAHAVAIGGADS